MNDYTSSSITGQAKEALDKASAVLNDTSMTPLERQEKVNDYLIDAIRFMQEYIDHIKSYLSR